MFASSAAPPEVQEAEVYPLLPPTPEDTDLETLHSVVQAQEDCERLQPGNEVLVEEDGELERDVVEVLGPRAKLSLVCASSMPLVALFLKNIKRFVSISIVVVDDAQALRTLIVTNQRSVARIGPTEAALPMALREGWQYVNIDAGLLVNKAFGTNMLLVKEVIVHGSCRVSSVYLQETEVAEPALPRFLRVARAAPRPGTGGSAHTRSTTRSPS